MSKYDRPIIKRITATEKKFNQGVIGFPILMSLAYRNLVFKKLRTTLTTMGVVIGVGSIVFLVSFGLGLRDLVSRQVVGSSSVQTIDVTSPQSKILKLDNDAIDRMSGLGGVDAVNKVYNAGSLVKYGSSQADSVLYGANQGYVNLSSLEFISGKVFDENSNDQIIVNESLLKVTGINDSNKSIGKKIAVDFELVNSEGDKYTVSKEFKIHGVYKSADRSESFTNSKVFEQAGAKNASQVKVVVNDKSQVPEVRKGIEALGYDTTSPLDTLDQINQVFTLLQFVLIGFGGIGMVIAILGMFNTLTISLIERTREIALMISLGARKQDVKRMFMIEALLLSFMGGLAGIIFATLLGVIGNVVLTQFAQSRGVVGSVNSFIVTPFLVLVTLLLSTVLGLLVVYFPARRASSINPIEALHND